MVKTVSLNDYSDVHYTNPRIAKKIVEHFALSGVILEPCKGSGNIYNHLPKGSLWCEIEQGIDFFYWNLNVDWILTNPPYSILTQFMQHCFNISNDVVLIIPISKYFSSVPRIELVKQYGGVKEILYLGSGRSMGFNLGFPMGAIHFSKNFKGDIKFSHLNNT